jgi:aspartyl-tRNA(Asn)/glutamyl-tRNA(Gln) amidotransferase subunit A
MSLTEDPAATEAETPPSPPSPLELSIAELGKKYRDGTLSPVDVVEASFSHIEKFDPTLNAFLRLTKERALTDAERLATELKQGKDRGPYHGVPYALKDNVDTAGILSTSHSKLFADRIPSENAGVVENLEAGGGILLGKLATFEFALGGPSWDLPAPPARNPWNPDYLPGGSSSGSAAAVAASFVHGAIGTDTGGSVRWPAAVCGLAGLKPTYGRISRRGVHPNTFSLDHCGPLTRSVADCAAMLQASAGYDPRDPGSINEPVPDYLDGIDKPIEGLRVGLVRHWYADDADPDVIAATDRAAQDLTKLGAIVEEIELAPLLNYVDAKTTISLCELFAVHEHDIKTRPDDFGKSLRSRVIAGGLIRAEAYVQAMRWRTELTTELMRRFASFDLLATAGWLGLADPADPDGVDFFKKRLLVTMPFSLTGIPALVMPSGFSKNGLPLSFQIAGRPFDEATVLRAGHAYQSITDWHTRRPPQFPVAA